MPSDQPRTVLHGLDQSCPGHADLPGPNKGNMAAKCYDEELMANHIWDADMGKWLPMEYVAFEYDFSEDGGYIGWHNLGVVVPAGTILMGGILNVIDPLTSGGAATLLVKVESAAGAVGDIVPTTLFSTIGSLGLHAITPVYTAATAILCTQDQQIKAEIRVAAITGGHLYGYLTCFRSWPSEEQSSSSSSQSTSSSVTSSSSSSATSSSSSSSTSSTDTSSSATTSSSSMVSTASTSSSTEASTLSTSSSESSSATTSSRSVSSTSVSSSSSSSSSVSSSSSSSVQISSQTQG